MRDTTRDIQSPEQSARQLLRIIFAEFLEKLQAAPNVDKAEYAGHQLVITYKSGKNNVAKLIEELSAAGITCNKIFSERPTLNDVFLELTGKELRD